MDYSAIEWLKLDAWDGRGMWFADEELDIAPSDGTF